MHLAGMALGSALMAVAGLRWRPCLSDDAMVLASPKQELNWIADPESPLDRGTPAAHRHSVGARRVVRERPAARWQRDVLGGHSQPQFLPERMPVTVRRLISNARAMADTDGGSMRIDSRQRIAMTSHIESLARPCRSPRAFMRQPSARGRNAAGRPPTRVRAADRPCYP